MARKTKVFIAQEERDKGKQFLITEMAAFRAERWARRVLMGLSRSKAPPPEGVLEMGMAGLSYFGIRAFMSMDFDEAEPLMAEMMECVSVIPDPRNPTFSRPMDDEDIEEVLTIAQLRSEVIELHTGFSPADWIRKLMIRSAPITEENSSDTPTSPEPSE